MLLNATASPATSYLWNTGATTPTITVDSTGRYVVTVTNNGCVSKDSMYLRETISTSVAVTILSNTTNTICAGDNVLLTADPAAGLPTAGQSFQWYKNSVILTGDTLNTYSSNSINNGDTLKVVLTLNNAGFCITGSTTATSTFPITVKQRPVLSTIPNQTLCFGDNTAAVTFSSNMALTGFNWTNSNPSIGLAASGTGNIPSFPGSNNNLPTQSATITVTPINNGCTGTNRTFTYTVNGCSLPVELIHFDGKKIEDFTNNLYWSTASEYNNDFFSLEHSQDLEHFTEIYRTKGSKNSSQQLNYNYTHQNVPKGSNLYRLKQVDLDGSYTYSNMINIINNSEFYQASVYPNPSTNLINIYINNPSGNSYIIIYDALGQLMTNQTLTEIKEQKIAIDISSYANGMYYISISDTKNKTTIPLIKQ